MQVGGGADGEGPLPNPPESLLNALRAVQLRKNVSDVLLTSSLGRPFFMCTVCACRLKLLA